MPRDVHLQALVRRRAFREFFGWRVVLDWRVRVALWLRSERKAWDRAFERADACIVAARIERFCHARATTYVRGWSGRDTDLLEGRRQVWLMIQAHRELSDEQLETMRQNAARREGLFDA